MVGDVANILSAKLERILSGVLQIQNDSGTLLVQFIISYLQTFISVCVHYWQGYITFTNIYN